MSDPQQAAAILWDAWGQDGLLEDLPEGARPGDRAEGYAAQAALATLAGGSIGWKIAATSAAGQKHIGVDGPLLGRLFERFAFADGATLPAAPLHMAVVEAEFAFRLGEDVAGEEPLSREAVLAATADLHLAVEVPESRFSDFATAGEAQLIADDACAGRFVLGPAVPNWRDVDLAAQATLIRVDGAEAATGVGANVLGDPRAALTWAVNELIAIREPPRAGQLISTGTTTTPPTVALGSEVVAEFGALGRVTLRFAEE